MDEAASDLHDAGRRLTGSTVGVVVIGRNEGERLVGCLRSLAPSRLPVVYVDSNSTDGSREVAKAAGAMVVELDLAHPFTAARARNEGATTLLAARPGLTYLQFVDGDCAVAPDWIETARDFLDSNPDAVIVCGRRRERFPERSIYNALCDEEWNTPVGEASACGGDAMMRVAAYLQAGGFDPAMVAHEEPELSARVRATGGRVFRIDAPMTQHDANLLRLRPWWRRNVRAGFGYAQAMVRHPSAGSAEAAMLRRALIWSVLPVVAALLAFVGWPLLGGALLLLYPLQIARLALRRRRAGRSYPWRAASLSLLGKFAEMFGALRFGFDALRRKRRGAILYR